MSNVHDQELNRLFKVAINCNECFTGNKLTRSEIDIAKPRWIRKHYWTAKPKVVIVLINPGAGATRRDDQDSKFKTLLREYKQDKISIEPIKIAFANIAWCGEAANRHPPWMLDNCFNRHTQVLLNILHRH
ncbi:MAG: hypothetical protein WAL59_16760 [Roseiarcus sp.]